MPLTPNNRIRYAVAPLVTPRADNVPVTGSRAAGSPPMGRAASGTPGVVAGYAILWDELSLDLGGFLERIVRGAVDDTLKAARDGTHDILFQYAHDGQHLIGRTSSGHLKLTTDATGLQYEIRLPDTTLSRDLFRLVAEGILKGASIGFSLGTDSWERRGTTSIRTIKKLTLWEVSLVSRPAYYRTSAQAWRSAPSPGTMAARAAWTAARLRAVAAKPHRMTRADALRADAHGIIRR